MKWIAVFISALVAGWLFVAAATFWGILDSHKRIDENKKRIKRIK